MEKRKILLGVLFVLILISLPSFIRHASYFILGHVEAMVIKNRWDLVLINMILFLIFLIPLNFRKKLNWKSMGVYAAFIASLFIEMYGIPLTIFLTSSVVSSGGVPPSQNPLFTITILDQTLAMTFWKIIGAIVSLIGIAIIIVGWTTLYQKKQEEGLVKSGIYKFSRHPQYLGIILISVGWFIHWPSLLTVLMLPILIYFYYDLTVKEDEELKKEISDLEAFEKYRKETPRFI